MSVFLSKSKLMSARQCLKRLHLEVQHPELKVISRATEAAFATGNQVGDVAHSIYGTDDSVFIPFAGGLGHALKKTRRLLAEGPAYPIFEATLQHAGVLVRIDALLPDGDGWRIVEVKASTSVKDQHVFDCTVQRWVFEGLGHKLTTIALAYVDNTFVYTGDEDYAGLLIESDQTDNTASMLTAIPEWITKAKRAAAGSEPAIGVGSHCYQPYECPFVGHCWPADVDYPLQGLGGSRAKLGEFVAEGMRDVRDVPLTRLTEKQKRIQKVTRAGVAELLPGARQFAESLEYPRYYLDFETIAPAVPIWPETRPYETLPIQWSCHYEAGEGAMAHSDFLDLTGTPPMRRLAESLIRALGSIGPVLMYTSYERIVIMKLIDRFPDLADSLSAIVERLVPTITTELKYSELEGIQEGTAASEGYLEAINPDTSSERKAELSRQLLRYCKFDTEAMVLLLRFLGQGP
jgi:hypothetical protein